MKLERLGNSLAVPLPDSVVEALDLREGDDVAVRIADVRQFEIEKTVTPDEWLVRLRKLRGMIPSDFKFDREEANAR